MDITVASVGRPVAQSVDRRTVEVEVRGSKALLATWWWGRISSKQPYPIGYQALDYQVLEKSRPGKLTSDKLTNDATFWITKTWKLPLSHPKKQIAFTEQNLAGVPSNNDITIIINHWEQQ